MDRTVIVTGGTGGLGVPVVQAFLDAGWRVVVPWVAEHELDRVPEREGLELVRADLFDDGAVRPVVATATGYEGAPLRGVVNLVGGFSAPGKVADTPIDEFEAQFRLNLRPLYLIAAAAIPHLIAAEGGTIVAVSTRAALRPFAGAAGYCSSKAAVLAFVGCLDAEYKDDGVRANAIVPSVIDTPGNRASQPQADTSRWVKPGQIAQTVLFLSSDASSATSGAAIPVYGRA
ncbi:MAG TPA: SDR family NAD(P)-dependent oxidoreductase [Solirubrobacteraceae bacterium]|nr:SDR family NAD(P)-dependent oxidoreductase [Solirubrobacteraceae bacterium]